MDIRHFFDKSRGKNIDIDEFPTLFILQNYKGICGLIFSSIWFVILAVYYRAFWNVYTLVFAGVVLVGFLSIILLSARFTQQIVDRALNDYSDWDYYARSRISLLIVLFAVTCSTLIWLTGGGASPFIPFYVMVYTLILSRCSVPHPGKALWVSYTLAFFIAGVLAWVWEPPAVDANVLGAIRNGSEKAGIDFAFALLSMAVPYFSTLWAEARERKRKSRLPPNGQNPS